MSALGDETGTGLNLLGTVGVRIPIFPAGVRAARLIPLSVGIRFSR